MGLTFSQIRSTVLGYAQEDRDNPENNQLWRIDDVNHAINCARHRMLRRIELGGISRKSEVVNAVAGVFDPPTDLFNQAIVKYTPPGGGSRVLRNVKASDLDIKTPGWRTQSAGEPTTLVWDLTITGLKCNLYPAVTATVPNGLEWCYCARLTDLADDSDTCPIMDLFPEFEYTLIQAGALWQLYMLEGGEGDDQIAKWKGVFESECDELKSMVTRIFVNEGRTL